MKIFEAMIRFLVYGFVTGVLIGLLAWLGGAHGS
jgi:hypothetical protein